MHRLSLGISPCPNDVFIFSGIILKQVELGDFAFDIDYQDVETLNHLASSGTLDIAKISYANVKNCSDQYDILSCGGALGRGVGPLLLTHDGHFDPAVEVLIPGEFTTANFLFDFYLGRKARKRFLPFDTLYEELCSVSGSQGVVIHEKRFTYEKDGLHLEADLGTYWESQTGFAIPLGAIAVRKTLDRAPLESLVQSSIDWAYTHYEDAFKLCRQYAQDLNDGVIESHIKLYVNEYSRSLGAEGESAVAYFLEKQRQLNASTGF